MVYHQPHNSRSNYNYNAFIYTNVEYGQHFHSNYELIYVIEGECETTVDGIPEKLHRGELLVIPPFSIHSLYISQGETWVGVFSEDFIPSFARKHNSVKYSKFTCEATIDDILKRYLFIAKQPEHFMLTSMLHLVLNQCVEKATAEDFSQDYNFKQIVISYISENLNNNLSLRTIAEELNYEYHYFSSLFNKYFSINFKSFVNQLRFQAACALLSDKNLSVTEIALKCGFGSVRNFNRIFQSISGITPSDFRKTYSKAKVELRR